MRRSSATTDRGSNKKGGKLLPALCNLVGILIILIVIGFCLSLVIPQRMGYQTYNIMSGSMEPEIPVGSMIYVETVPPAQVKPGDVIVYKLETSVVAHRVVENRVVSGEFVTKGDANEAEDMRTVPYSALLGRVRYHVDNLGNFMMLYTSSVGKVYVLAFALCGVLFHVLAERLRARRREEQKEPEAAEAKARTDTRQGES